MRLKLTVARTNEKYVLYDKSCDIGRIRRFNNNELLPYKVGPTLKKLENISTYLYFFDCVIYIF